MTRATAPSSATPAPLSRRRALQGAAAGGLAALGGIAVHSASAQTGTPVASPSTPSGDVDGLSQEVVELFRTLPGQSGLAMWAPPDAGRPGWSALHNADTQFFIASAFKAFALAACLRQEEAALDPTSDTPLAAQLRARLAQPLTISEAVFTSGSSVFNPPNLTGEVTLQTTLEAMISHSDNTATEMVLNYVGADNVQAFVDSIGLTQTRIPAGTRQFIGYLLRLPDWETTTWEQSQGEALGPVPPLLNDEITMASTPSEMVSFYARALQGEFFQYAPTLAVFRAILSLADAIAGSMPLGVSAFGKGGALQFPPDFVVTFGGGMFVRNRWVYFALLLNWTSDDASPDANVTGDYIAAVQSIFRVVRDRFME